MPRRPSNTRIASLAAALAAGALAAFALRPGDHGGVSAGATGAQVAEVRTQVIRRTIHVVHHERPPRARRAVAPGVTAARAGSGAALHTASSGSRATGTPPAETAPPRSRASGAPVPASSPGPTRPRSHTSGSRPGAGSGTTTPVRTRSSGAAGAGPGAKARTRTSGGREDGGDHGD